jgi:DNA-binding Lrp family transcriptional regulator
MSKSSEETMKKDRKKVLDVLEQHAKDNIQELAKRCGFSRQKILRIIKDLENEKLIWGYSAITDGTLRELEHFVLLLRRSIIPLDNSIRKDALKGILDDFVSEQLKIENIYFTHGMYEGVITFYATDLISAKNFVAELFKRIGEYFDAYILLQTLIPLRLHGIKNPNMKKLAEYI